MSDTYLGWASAPWVTCGRCGNNTPTFYDRDGVRRYKRHDLDQDVRCPNGREEVPGAEGRS